MKWRVWEKGVLMAWGKIYDFPPARENLPQAIFFASKDVMGRQRSTRSAQFQWSLFPRQRSTKNPPKSVVSFPRQRTTQSRGGFEGLVAQCSATPATVAATPPCSATPFQTQISVRHLPAHGGGGATPKYLGGVNAIKSRKSAATCVARHV